MNKDEEVSASIEIRNKGRKPYAAQSISGPSLDPATAEDPERVKQALQAELGRISEQRGKVLAGSLLRDFVQMMGTLEEAIDSADKEKISRHVVKSLADKEIEVLSWVLGQDISGMFADELSARVVDRNNNEPQDPAVQIDHMPSEAEPEDAVHEAGEIQSTSQTQDEPKSSDREEQSQKENKKTAAEMEEKAKRLAHYKAGLNSILMQSLPGTVHQLFAKGKFGTAKQIIARLGDALISQDSAVRAAVSEPLARSLDAVPPELRVHTTRELLNNLISWIELETTPSPAFERNSVQLENLAKMLLCQQEYDECMPILKAFTPTNSGKPQRDEALQAVANRALTNIGTDEVIGLLIKDFRRNEGGKGIQAGFCLSKLDSIPVNHLLDALSESQKISEQKRLVQLISQIGHPAVSAVEERIERGGPSNFMRNLAVLLGRVGSKANLGLLKILLEYKDVHVREAALNSIGKIGGEHGGEMVLPYLSSADDEFKIKIISVLGNLRYRHAVQSLLELIESRPAFASDSRDELEEAICVALGRIGSEDSIKVLSSIAKQKKFWSVRPFSENVQKAAQQALKQMSANNAS
ncbi:MAG: HEAT repeat domain-containing protein [Deltaproteobacteria bacterium]|nr:HEAT repeat domain-containing protein [Deltaproteobacteria bacterium]